jgi:hypothetical protein
MDDPDPIISPAVHHEAALNALDILVMNSGADTLRDRVKVAAFRLHRLSCQGPFTYAAWMGCVREGVLREFVTRVAEAGGHLEEVEGDTEKFVLVQHERFFERIETTLAEWRSSRRMNVSYLGGAS